jgi:hypothetical protein
MATAVSDLIELAYFNSLKTISSGATYENTPVEVVRADEEGTALVPGRVVLVCELPKETEEAPMLRDSYRMRVIVQWCVGKGVNEAELKTLAHSRASDLRKWLGANYTATARVKNFLSPITEVGFVNEFAVARLEFEALFYSALNDPYTLG